MNEVATFMFVPMPGYPATSSSPVLRSRLLPLALAVDRLREINFPAKAIRNRELVRRAPGVLCVGEDFLLAVFGVADVLDKALEGGRLAEQQRSEAQTAGYRLGGVRGER